MSDTAAKTAAATAHADSCCSTLAEESAAQVEQRYDAENRGMHAATLRVLIGMIACLIIATGCNVYPFLAVRLQSPTANGTLYDAAYGGTDSGFAPQTAAHLWQPSFWVPRAALAMPLALAALAAHLYWAFVVAYCRARRAERALSLVGAAALGAGDGEGELLAAMPSRGLETYAELDAFMVRVERAAAKAAEKRD
jgi:hypothetical protein